MNDFFFISSTDNNRLLELEIEVENLKIQTEELKTKLQCFEETKRLRKWKNFEAVEQLTLKTLTIRFETFKLVLRILILIIHHVSRLTVYGST